jgi:hypothetical protein
LADDEQARLGRSPGEHLERRNECRAESIQSPRLDGADHVVVHDLVDANSPTKWIIGMLLLWIIVSPVYLAKRGQAPRKA